MSLQNDKIALKDLFEEFNARPYFTGKKITGIKFLLKSYPGYSKSTVFATGTMACGYPLLPNWGNGLAVQVLNYLRSDPNRSPSPVPFLSYDK